MKVPRRPQPWRFEEQTRRRQFDEERRLRRVGVAAAPAAGGGGGGSVEVTIACDDASAAVKAKADLVADGTNDEEQFYDAIEMISGGGTDYAPGLIRISGGSLYVSEALTSPEACWISGCGKGATYIFAADDFSFGDPLMVAATSSWFDMHITDLTLWGSSRVSDGILWPAAYMSSIERVEIGNVANCAVRLPLGGGYTAQDVIIADSTLSNRYVAGTAATESVLRAYAPYLLKVARCNIDGGSSQRHAAMIEYGTQVVFDTCDIFGPRHGIYQVGGYRNHYLNNGLFTTPDSASSGLYCAIKLDDGSFGAGEAIHLVNNHQSSGVSAYMKAFIDAGDSIRPVIALNDAGSSDNQNRYKIITSGATDPIVANNRGWVV